MLSISPSFGLGLGITLPVIQLYSCPSRMEPPEDVNFPKDAPRSPVVVVDTPEVEYLEVPPPQFCDKDRVEAEASTRSRSHVHRLSTLTTIASLHRAA